jgi:uncharacterized membrane protein YkoI
MNLCSHANENRFDKRLLFLVGAVLLFVGACATNRVTIDQVPPKVREAIEKMTAGGVIEEIQAEEDKVFIYEVEYEKDGRKYEASFDEDGEVVKTEEHFELHEVPAAVRDTIEQVTVGGFIREIEKETESDRMFYEVKFEKDGKMQEIEISKDGEIIKD